MKLTRVLIAVGVIAALLVPATTTAKVTRTDKHNAKKECKALRKAAGKTNFARLMHTSKRKAYGLCVKRKSREESRERGKARANAARTCRDLTKEELVSPSQPWFSLLNHNKSNAFGKCVSWNARKKKEDMDEHDQNVINAARTCPDLTKDELVSPSPPWFSLLNHNQSNAFGKCVSWNARHKENSSSS
jgi:hypothetical protein